MTDKIIAELSLEYLMNKDSYERYRMRTNSSVVKANKKDKKFYRRRISDLTKKFLYPSEINSEQEYISPDIHHTFDLYVKACVEYFKNLDKSDILQEDYNELLDIDVKNEINVDSIQTSEEADQLMMRSIRIREPNNLEKLVTRKSLAPQNTIIPPQQKDINLKDPELKNKGIRKKKNITNTYEKKDNKNATQIQKKKSANTDGSW
jgi:hypothetical protein